MPPTIMISCGEPSGDLYAAALAREINALDPTARLIGFGGERLAAVGADLPGRWASAGDYRGLTVTGLSEALAVLPRSLGVYRRLLALAGAERPAVFVPIDFPDFNFRLAAAMRRLGVPVVYYVSPQLWAWRPGRMRTMKRIAERVLVIFPFEEEIYRRAGVPVEFVGHPLLDLARAEESRTELFQRHGLDPGAPAVALLPGSRPNELRAILPTLARAAALIGARLSPVQFLLARVPGLSDPLFTPLQAPGVPRVAVVEGKPDTVLAACDVAITASGTATVQAAIHERPMVIVYRVSPWTYRLGKPFVQLDTYGMVNLIAGERIVPELIQGAFTPEAVATEALSFLTDRERSRRTSAALRRVREKLGAPGASRRAAEAVLRVARRGG